MQTSVAKLLSTSYCILECEELSYFEPLETERGRISVERPQYIYWLFILPISSNPEHFFKRCKHILIDWRKSISPIEFEAVIFLKVNREFLDVNNFASALKVQTPSEVRNKHSDLIYNC